MYCLIFSVIYILGTAKTQNVTVSQTSNKTFETGVLLGSVSIDYEKNESDIYREKRKYSEENDDNVVQYINVLNLALSKIQDEKCRNDVYTYLHGISNLTTWAIEMLDSTSKFPTGLLEGNIRDLGNFDECLGVRANNPITEDEMFRGQYCLAQVYIETDFRDLEVGQKLDYLLHRMTAGRRNIEDTRRKGLAYFPSFSKFELAICVPSSCLVEDLQVISNYLFSELISFPEVHVQTEIDVNNCYTYKPLDFQIRDFIFISFILVLVILISTATVYEVIFKRKQEKEMFTKQASYSNLLTCFSLTDNVKKLMNFEAAQESIKCVDSMRVLTILWVILTHKVFCMTQEAWTNKVFLIEAVKDFEKMPILNSMLDVDTFFLIGGLVRSYNMLRELDNQKFDYCVSFFQRYLRLTPAYAGMVAFFATVSVYIGSGPYWHTGMEFQSELCRENWIWNILYVNNYVDSNRKCMLQTWYLSADMHLFLLSPFLIYPLWRWPKYGLLLMACSIGASVAIPFFTIYVHSLPGVQYSSVSDSLLSDYAQYIYYPTHQRMSPYFAGLILGYILHKTKSEKVHIPKFLSLLLWGLSLATLAAVIFGPYKLIQFDHEYDALESSVYGGIHRLAWGVAVAWTIFACHKGYGGIINKGLSARIFRPLSRLSYCMFLTHLGILHYGVSKMRTSKHMDEYSIIHDFTGDIVLTVIASVILHFCLESPFLNITKIITAKINEWKQKRKRRMISPVV